MKNTLKQKSGGKPHRNVIQPDNMADMPFGAGIIPGAAIFLPKQQTADILSDKDAGSIDTSAQQWRATLGETAKRLQEGSQTIDGKHPYRGLPA